MTYSFIRVVGAIRPFDANEKGYFSITLKKLNVSSVIKSESIVKTIKAVTGIETAVVIHSRFLRLKPSGADAWVPATTSPTSDWVLMLICRQRNKTMNQVIENNTKTAVMVIYGSLQNRNDQYSENFAGFVRTALVMFGVYSGEGDFTMEEFAAAPQLNRTRAIERPLLGLTILLVEDSRFFSDAVRLMSIRSGARLRRADCIMSARKHVRIYRPDVVLVDIGLPDGSGDELIQEISKMSGPPPVIAMSGAADGSDKAIAAGAALFLQKPFFDMASFQQTILSIMPESSGVSGFQPRVAGDLVSPDKESLREDFCHILELLKEAAPAQDVDCIRYCAQFLSSVARVSGDDVLAAAGLVLNTRLNAGGTWDQSCQQVLELLGDRLAA
jgi:CheY-like chemotaxis protein